MPISYEIDRESGVAFRRYEGEITIDEIAANWREMLSDPRAGVHSYFALVSDMRNGNILYTGAQLEQFVRSVLAPSLGGRRMLSAMVVESPLQFGVMRQFSSYADDLGEVGVFYDLESARGWLESSMKQTSSTRE